MLLTPFPLVALFYQAKNVLVYMLWSEADISADSPVFVLQAN